MSPTFLFLGLMFNAKSSPVSLIHSENFYENRMFFIELPSMEIIQINYAFGRSGGRLTSQLAVWRLFSTLTIAGRGVNQIRIEGNSEITCNLVAFFL